MKPELKKVVEGFMDRAEKFLLSEVEKSGMNIGFALHVNISDGPGGMISNIPVHQQIDYANYCLRNIKKSLESCN